MRKIFIILAILFGLLIVGVSFLAVNGRRVWDFLDLPLEPPPEVLVYEVDPEFTPEGVTVDMAKVATAIIGRLDSEMELIVRPISARRIEIVIFRASSDARERVERLMDRTGTLEFRILANPRDHQHLLSRADANLSDTRFLDSAGNLLGWWVPVADGYQRQLAHSPDIKMRTRKIGRRDRIEVLVTNDNYNVTGDYLQSVVARLGPEGPTVDLVLNSEGASKFAELTGHNLPDGAFARYLGIIIDGKLYVAPAIRSKISDQCQITEIGSQEEVDATAAVLRAGTCP